MLKQISLALILAFVVAQSHAEGQAQTSPKELVEYIRQAKGAGLDESEIRKNAENAGWPRTIVTAAIAAAGTTEKSIEHDNPAPVPPTLPRPKTAVDPDHPAAPTVPRPAHASPSANDSKPATSDHGGVSDDYLIGAGDVLAIHVWKEPDASVASAVVRPEGKISMPLLKEVSVLGLTPAQAEQRIAQQLSNFITAPDVTVVVSAINSKKVYVVGAVKKEGPIAYTYRMTIMQALGEAGGLTDYAKRKKIYVLRNENGRDFRFPFDYDAALRGEHMELNIPLLAGDTLVVPH